MHKGSRDVLLGASPSAKLIDLYSNDLQVTKQTPPTFLVHSGNDHTVKVTNSIRFYEALQKNGVNAELHIYPLGGHGFGLSNSNWIDRTETWMKDNGWIK